MEASGCDDLGDDSVPARGQVQRGLLLEPRGGVRNQLTRHVFDQGTRLNPKHDLRARSHTRAPPVHAGCPDGAQPHVRVAPGRDLQVQHVAPQHISRDVEHDHLRAGTCSVQDTLDVQWAATDLADQGGVPVTVGEGQPQAAVHGMAWFRRPGRRDATGVGHAHGGAPAGVPTWASHARTWATILSTPSPLRRLLKTRGRSPRTRRASRSITSSDAPTCGARSILLMTRRSERMMPGPPFDGILSPAATSIT